MEPCSKKDLVSCSLCFLLWGDGVIPCENSTSWRTFLHWSWYRNLCALYLIPRYWAPSKLKGGSTYTKKEGKKKQKEEKRRLSSPCTGLKELSHSVKQAQSSDQVIRAQKCYREMYLYRLFFLSFFFFTVLETCLQLPLYHHASIQVCILNSYIFFSFLSEWKLKGTFSAVNITAWFSVVVSAWTVNRKLSSSWKASCVPYLSEWKILGFFFPHEVWASCLVKPASKLDITIHFCTVLRAELCKSLWYANTPQKRLANAFHVTYAPYLSCKKKKRKLRHQ